MRGEARGTLKADTDRVAIADYFWRTEARKVIGMNGVVVAESDDFDFDAADNSFA